MEVFRGLGSDAIGARVRVDQNEISRDRTAAGNRSDQIGAFGPEGERSPRKRGRDPNEVSKVVPVLQLAVAVETNEAKITQPIREGGQLQVGDRARQCPAVRFPGISAILPVLL